MANAPCELVANPEVEVVANGQNEATDFDAEFEEGEQQFVRLSGWRVERNSNGYFRYRWQLKDGKGEPETYKTSSGNVGYKRGSKYLPLAQAYQEMYGNGKKRR